MSSTVRLTTLTFLGARASHRALSAAFHQPFFDHRGGNLSLETLDNAIAKAQYYGWANLVRAAFYVPVVFGLRGTGHWFSLSLVVGLVVFHLICVLAENYKAAAARYLLAHRRYTELKEPPRPLPDYSLETKSYFLPRKFESERAYRSIGIEFVRKIANWFNDVTQVSAKDRRSGKRAAQMTPSRAGILLYESDTRQAERMHVIAGALNIPPLASLILLAKWNYAAWVGFIIFMDLSLVLLQRYLRVRVVNRLKQIDSKRAARTAVAS